MNSEFEQSNLEQATQEDASRLRMLVARGALAFGILGGAAAVSVAEAEPASAACRFELVKNSQGKLVPIEICDEEPTPTTQPPTTTPPPDKPPVTQPPKPKPEVVIPPTDVDGDGFIESIDHNDKSAPQGEVLAISNLPFGEGFLNQTVTNTRGEEVSIGDYLEQAAIDSLPDDLQSRYAELIEYGQLKEQMNTANVNADGDNYIAGPNGQFSVTLFEAGLNGGDLEDTMPGSYEPVNQLRLAGINLSDPVVISLQNGETTMFDSGFMLLNHVGYGWEQFANDWLIAVDTYETEKAEQEAAIQAELDAQEALAAAQAAVEAANEEQAQLDATAAQAKLDAEAGKLNVAPLPVGNENPENTDASFWTPERSWTLVGGGFLTAAVAFALLALRGKRRDEDEEPEIESAEQQPVDGNIVPVHGRDAAA